MAQLKVKQILDFVTQVESINNTQVGTSTVTAISTAKSESLSSAYSADVVAKSEALVAAQSADTVLSTAVVGQVSTAKSEAISTAVSADAVVKSEAISTAVSADVVVKSQAISTAVSADAVLSTAVVGQISTAKSEAISAALSADSTLSSAISTEKARIDALLLNSTAALDTFAEIEGFITSLETSDVSGLSAALSTAVSNDAVHTSDIATINTTINAYGDIVRNNAADFDAAGSAADALVSANAYADGLAVNYDAAGSAAAALVSANAYTDLVRTDFGLADTAITLAYQGADAIIEGTVTALDGRVSANETDIATINTTIGAYGDIVAYDRADFASAAQGALADSAVQNLGDLSITATATELNQLDNVTLGDIVTYSASDFTAATAFNTLAGRVDTLEALDVVQQVGNFVDVRTFALPFGVSTSDNNIAVFINGLQIHEYDETSSPDGYTTLDGRNFTLTSLGYDLEADDHIIVLGVLA